MPVPGAIKLADANVWLALAFSDHLHHAKAKAWFDGQSDGSCAFCRVTQMVLLRHLTNSKIMGPFVQSEQDAWKNYDKLTQDPRVILRPGTNTREALRPLDARGNGDGIPPRGTARRANPFPLAARNTSPAPIPSRGGRTRADARTRRSVRDRTARRRRVEGFCPAWRKTGLW